MRRIACLHAALSNIGVFEAARRELGLDIALRHCVRPDLLEAVEEQGELTNTIAALTIDQLQRLCDRADAVLLTCSTLGPVVTEAVRGARAPILRADQALADEAAQNGGRVVVLCAAEATLALTRGLFEQAAGATGAQIDMRLVAGAWATFKAGDLRRYIEMIAETADAARRDGAACVALAQASMAPARALCRMNPAPLDSSSAGLRAALAAITP